jgi:hypothetical protein
MTILNPQNSHRLGAKPTHLGQTVPLKQVASAPEPPKNWEAVVKELEAQLTASRLREDSLQKKYDSLKMEHSTTEEYLAAILDSHIGDLETLESQDKRLDEYKKEIILLKNELQYYHEYVRGQNTPFQAFNPTNPPLSGRPMASGEYLKPVNDKDEEIARLKEALQQERDDKGRLKEALQQKQDDYANLIARVTELEAKLACPQADSTNSGMAPSSGIIGKRARGKKNPPDNPDDPEAAQKRKRGAQKGHKGKCRSLFPLAEADKIIDLDFNEEVCCSHCGEKLERAPQNDLQQDHYEYPEKRSFKVIEISRAYKCPKCGKIHYP